MLFLNCLPFNIFYYHKQNVSHCYPSKSINQTFNICLSYLCNHYAESAAHRRFKHASRYRGIVLWAHVPCGKSFMWMSLRFCSLFGNWTTTALCNGKLCCPLLFYFLFGLSSLPDFTPLSNVNKLQPKRGSACVWNSLSHSSRLSGCGALTAAPVSCKGYDRQNGAGRIKESTRQHNH